MKLFIWAVKKISVIVVILTIIGCANLPKDFDRPQTYAFSDTSNTALGRSFADEKEANPGKSGFYLLGNGLDAFAARAVLAGSAERSIDVQYYLYHDDLIGRLLTDQLIKAADRGVRVRMLLDDMGLAGKDLGVKILASHPNIDIRIFNPFSRNVRRNFQFITRAGSVTRRMHNKSFNVDNQAAILGGRNIGNEYFAADPDIAFADLDVITIGPVVQEVSGAFDSYWNSELAYPVSVLIDEKPTQSQIDEATKELDDYIATQHRSEYVQALRDSNLVRNLRSNSVELEWGDADIVFDQPEKVLHDFEDDQYHLAPQLKPYLDAIKNELLIISPYFVPGESGTIFLTQLVEKGVRVRILTNSLASNDVGIVHAGYAKYRHDLLKGGVELFEMNKILSKQQREGGGLFKGSTGASLHAKSFAFDRRQIFIGSLNLDPRSFIHNTEIGMIITSPVLAAEFAEWFDQNIEKLAFRLELDSSSDSILWHGIVEGEPTTFDHDPYTSFWRRLLINILGMLPIESQL